MTITGQFWTDVERLADAIVFSMCIQVCIASK